MRNASQELASDVIADLQRDRSSLLASLEQLRGPDDQWVKWVKAYLSPCAKPDVEGIDYSDRSKPELEDLIAKPRSDLEKYRIAKCYLVKYGGSGIDAAKYFDVLNFYEAIPERR